MLVSVIILLLLLLGFRYGFKRGLIQTLLSVLGYVVVLILSLYFSRPFSEFLIKYLPSLDQQTSQSGTVTVLFYRVLAFWIIAIVGGVVFRIVTQTFTSLAKLPVVSQLNSLAGGLVWLLATYVLVFFGLLLLTTNPATQVQDSLTGSTVAQFMLDETPVFSEQVFEGWQK